MKKLRINESAEIVFTPDFDVQDNVFTSGDFDEYADFGDFDDFNDDGYVEDTECNVYECLEALGFMFSLAANDVHTVHINACGDNFQELHECADEVYNLLNGYSDHAFEMACEDGHYIHNINEAGSLVDWNNYACSGCCYDIVKGSSTIIEILNDVICRISELYNDVDSSIQSVMDEWTRELTSKANYFLKRVQGCSCNESIMSASVRNRRRRKSICEHLDKLKLGQSYTMFCQVEDHIDDYNCDPLSLKKGDYVIRDFQFGHLPNGGNKGYIPYEVIDILEDEDSYDSGYHYFIKTLLLSDGFENHELVVQNGRFNGILHKLKKASVEKSDETLGTIKYE